MLLNKASKASNHAYSHLFYCVKRGHQDKSRNIPMSSQIGSSSTANRSTHDMNILSCFSCSEQIIIELKRIFFDSVRYKGWTADWIGAIMRVLYGIKSNIEVFDQRFKKHANYCDILSISMKIDKTVFSLSAFHSRDFHIRNFFAIPLNWFLFTVTKECDWTLVVVSWSKAEFPA